MVDIVEYDGTSFIEKMTKFRQEIQYESFQEDFDSMVSYMESAMKDHNVEDIVSIWHILHDMDYYLLRYASEEYDGAVTDSSDIEAYYNALQVYSKN